MTSSAASAARRAPRRTALREMRGRRAVPTCTAFHPTRHARRRRRRPAAARHRCDELADVAPGHRAVPHNRLLVTDHHPIPASRSKSRTRRCFGSGRASRLDRRGPRRHPRAGRDHLDGGRLADARARRIDPVPRAASRASAHEVAQPVRLAEPSARSWRRATTRGPRTPRHRTAGAHPGPPEPQPSAAAGRDRVDPRRRADLRCLCGHARNRANEQRRHRASRDHFSANYQPHSSGGADPHGE